MLAIVLTSLFLLPRAWQKKKRNSQGFSEKQSVLWGNRDKCGV